MASKAYLNAAAGAVPEQDVHAQFVDWAAQQIDDERTRSVFRRMADRSGIDHRWSVLPRAPDGGTLADPGGFYESGNPPTSARMAAYAEHAPELALAAVEQLAQGTSLAGITHLVVASCTGFVAPGIDQILAQRLGLGDVERTLVGFMGCYAAVSALRVARHIVRSEPQARVLVVTVEISSLHLRPLQELEPLLAMLQFGDGAAAAIVSGEPGGFELGRSFALTLPDSAELIGWKIGDTGFEMQLSGEVPGRIAAALQEEEVRTAILDGRKPEQVDHWAVHAGGRSILDGVERGLGLPQGALAASREVLRRFGNMSSSTLLFVLADQLALPNGRDGVALAFGPGLAAEGFTFARVR